MYTVVQAKKKICDIRRDKCIVDRCMQWRWILAPVEGYVWVKNKFGTVLSILEKDYVAGMITEVPCTGYCGRSGKP